MSTTTPEELCPCGLPLHYAREESRQAVEDLVTRLGRTQLIRVPGLGAWMVPRHYVALHGIVGRDLPFLAGFYGWERVP